jgi:hypothetical protein
MAKNTSSFLLTDKRFLDYDTHIYILDRRSGAVVWKLMARAWEAVEGDFGQAQ